MSTNTHSRTQNMNAHRTTDTSTQQYHFYRKVIEPDIPNLKYRDHSLGLVGYDTTVDLDNYLGFYTIKEVEDAYAKRGSHGARRFLINLY